MIALVDILATGVRNESDEALAFGTVTVYEAGTTTLATTYQDRDQEDPHSNPLTLDAAGRAMVWAENRVKLVIQDADGELIRTIDNVGISDEDVAAAQAGNLAGDGLIVNEDDELSVNPDGTSIAIVNNAVQIKDKGVSSGKLADANTVISALSSGSHSETSTDLEDVTNLSAEITTSGRPVEIMLVPDNTSITSPPSTVSAVGGTCALAFVRGSTVLGVERLNTASFPAGAFRFVDHSAPAGTYTYKIQAAVVLGSAIAVSACKLRVTEL